MEMIILIIIAVVVIRFVKKKRGSKPVKVYSIGDPSQLPNTLAELRKMRDKAKPELAFQCSRKICDLGIQLFQQGMLTAQSGTEYDVNVLLAEMYHYIDDANTYAYIPTDEVFEFRCLQAGTQMGEYFQLTPAGDVSKFIEYAWPHLADFYAEGKVCPRNPDQARKYYRMHITFEANMRNMHTSSIEGLMEVPAPGEEGRQEILKYIALMYGIGALQIKQREIVRNFHAQTLQQSAELLFRMDWARIGSPDIGVMLDEYNRQAMAGNAYAQYMLGRFLLKGRYVQKDEARGLALLEQAAAQDLYLAVDELSNHYYWLAHPYAGDHGDASKADIRRYEALSDKWSKRCDALSGMVEMAYANSFTDYIRNSADLPTRGPGKIFDTPREETAQPQPDAPSEPAKRSSIGFEFPSSVIGPGNERFYRMPLSGFTEAKYENDEGFITTIHVSHIGSDGHSAHNSDGSFYW